MLNDFLLSLLNKHHLSIGCCGGLPHSKGPELNWVGSEGDRVRIYYGKCKTLEQAIIECVEVNDTKLAR